MRFVIIHRTRGKAGDEVSSTAQRQDAVNGRFLKRPDSRVMLHPKKARS